MGAQHEVARGDFDGDGMADPTIVDRASGLWWTSPSNGAPTRFWEWRWDGMSALHEVAPGDFDGDGVADRTIVYRPAGLWWTTPSGAGAPPFWEWGWVGMGGHHEVVSGDFDGDGVSDRTIVDRAAGTWWTVPSSGAASRFWGWGWAGMGAQHEVVPGDYDGDGMDDPAIVDRARGLMWITTSNGSPPSVWGHRIPHFGADREPAPGDYDGDGRTDIAFVHRASGRWFIRPSSRACPALRVPVESAPGVPWRYEGGEGYPDIVDPADGCTAVVSTRDELLAALAAAQPGTTVYVADTVGIDLTGMSVAIPQFVTLASGRGRGGSLGGLLYTTQATPGGMLRAVGEGVRITGLRIRGHQSEVCPNDDSICGPFSRGIQSSSSTLEVDNCVLTGWTYAAVAINSSFGTHIHHNFIHHNQREESGYGIVLESETLGSQALIEWNRFNNNRHAVAGGGGTGQSYVARYNLVGARSIGHVFDMHDGNPATIAGTNIQIYGNAVMVLDWSMVRVRSRPTEGAWTFGNCFARARVDDSLPWYARDAVAQTGTLGNFWVDYQPDATPSPNRYGQTAEQCGVAEYLR